MDMSKKDKEDKVTSKASAALAWDIIQNKLHLPLDEDNKINVVNIEDQITIGLYSGELAPLTQEIVDLAMDVIQDMVDVQVRTMKNGGT